MSESSDECEAKSGEIIAGNKDLSNEIFIRLPATYLVQCSWVSKTWFSFLSDPTFIQRHNLVQPPSLSGLFLIPRHTTHPKKVHFLSLNQRKPKFPFSDFLNSRRFQIVDSCNGLLICHSQESGDYTICNPTTRMVKILPKYSQIGNGEFALKLVWDPVISTHYKVVHIQKVDGHSGLYEISQYSSQNGEWTPSKQPVFVPENVNLKSGVFCNNAIHWVKNKLGSYLELNTMTVRDMPELPRKEEYHYNIKFKYFGKSQGRLFYVITNLLQHCLELYQMKKDYSGWDFKYRVDLDVLKPTFMIMGRHWGFPTQFSECENDVLAINGASSDESLEIVLSIPGQVIVLHFENITASIPYPVFRYADEPIWLRIHSAFQFFETVSLV
ncbi:F-box protein At5g07610-like [Silene latifolia]|uniref:F-box protein At5g07610-like n=1 Tax=Silene latifolia TaxID=37657 RepID=UPI003D778781